MADLQFFNHPGDKKRLVRRWDKDRDRLEVVKEIDIQKEIDEAAKGMTLSEQLARAWRGDNSVFRDDEPFYGDVSQVPEMVGDTVANTNQFLNQVAEEISAEKKAKLEAAQKKVEEAQKELQAVQEEKENA